MDLMRSLISTLKSVKRFMERQKEAITVVGKLPPLVLYAKIGTGSPITISNYILKVK